MSEQENLICRVCGQDHHNRNLVKWCDRSDLEIKFQAAQDKIQQLEAKNKIMREALVKITICSSRDQASYDADKALKQAEEV